MISASWPTLGQMFAMPDEELAGVDPVVMNLVVAKGIPSLAELNIGHYVQLADSWAKDLSARMPKLEVEFQRTPQHWKNDIDFFRLGLVCWYADVVLGVAYREDQRNATRISYTDPTDLFLNGVMDSLRGTCGNLSVLHVVLGRRIGLPVSLACAGAHHICRFDDGNKIINIETTNTGKGGFSSQTDDAILAQMKLPSRAQACGSDLRAVTPREMLGLFIGSRARHFENMGKFEEAESDYLLARHLFLNNRTMFIAQHQTSVQQAMRRFEPGEMGHPTELAEWLQKIVFAAPWKQGILTKANSREKINGKQVDALFGQAIIGANFR